MAAKPTKRKPITKKLPAAPTGKSPSRNYAALAEEEFGASGFAGKSLLRSVVGAVRIPAPRNSLLAELVKRRQSIYAAILGRIMCGSSLIAAACAVGLSRETVRRWMIEGLENQQAGEDTYYARFASDVYAALAHSVGEAELAVMRRNPIEYLRSGPGRAFYQERENYWQPVDPRAAPSTSDIEPLVEIASEQTDTLSASRASEALDRLKELGIIDNPEYAKQIIEQSGQGRELVNGSPVVNTLPVVDGQASSVQADSASGSV